MNIQKQDTPIWVRVLSIATTYATIGLAAAGYEFAHNILWAMGVLGLVAAAILTLSGTKMYRPGIPKQMLVALDVVQWLILAGLGWWGLMALYVIADCLILGCDATDEEYLSYLESKEV